MAKIIEAEYSNVDGSSKPQTTRKQQNKPKKTKNGGISDQGDEYFSASSGGEVVTQKTTLMSWRLPMKRNLEPYYISISRFTVTDWISFAAGQHFAFKNYPI